MPQTFGDAFNQAYQFGTKIAEEQDAAESQSTQEAAKIAFQEKQLAATKALEGLKMDALNKQITIQQQEADSNAKYKYDSTINERAKNFNASFLPMNPNKYTRQLGVPTHSSDELKNLFPGVDIPQGNYVDSQSHGMISSLIANDRLAAIAQRKEDAANAPFEAANKFGQELNSIEDPSPSKNPKYTMVPNPEYSPFDKLLSTSDEFIAPTIAQKVPTVDSQSAAKVLDSLAQLSVKESSFMSANPKLASELNQHPAFVGTRSRMWDIMNQVQGQNLPVSPITQTIMSKMNNQYNALKIGYNQQTQQEEERITNQLKASGQEDKLKDALTALHQARNDYNFEQLFKNLPFDPTIGVKAKPVQQPF